MGLRGHLTFTTLGSGGFWGGRNAQCLAQGAPSSIQRRSSSICSGLSFLPLLGGGMRSDGSGELIRSISLLSDALPGTMA